MASVHPQDLQTYQRGASAALFGLVIQLLLVIGFTLMGIWAQSPPIYAAAMHMVAGLAIWLVLLIIFYQHKLERTEALEVERLATSDSKAAALFDDREDQLNVHRGRLENLYKYGLHIVAGGVSLYLLIAGIVLLVQNYDLAAAVLGWSDVEESPPISALRNDRAGGWLLPGLALVAAFVAFVIARYLAGMVRVKQWQMLRGGASYLMSCALIAVITAVIAGIGVYQEQPTALAWLGLVVPAIMTLVGTEILLTLLLNIYRPRRPGEIPRPAFDSRLLGFLTAPQSIGKIISESINYQFGFEVSKSWFYRLLGRALTPMIAFALAILLLASCVVIVKPHQQAVILTFGDKGAPVESGLHLKWPWPISTVNKYAVHRLQQVTVGRGGEIKEGVAILWTNAEQHIEGEEGYLLTAARPREEGSTSRGNEATATDGESPRGMSLVAAELSVQFFISDLDQYLNASEAPKELIQSLASRHLTALFMTTDLDSLLTSGRERISREIRENIQADADRLKLGINVVFAGLTGLHPPSAEGVAEAFQEQIASLQKQQSTIEQARADYNRRLAEAAGSREAALEINEAIVQLETLTDQLESATGAEAADLRERREKQAVRVRDLIAEASGRSAELLNRAWADRWSLPLAERALARKFEAERKAYDEAPKYYRAKRYYETLADALVEPRKVVVPRDAVKGPVLRFDIKQEQADIDFLTGE